MRKRKWMTTLAAVMAISMILSGCTGGTTSPASAPPSGTSTASSAAPANDNLSAPGQLPIVKEQMTVRLGLVQSAVIEDYYDNKFTSFLEKETNLKFEFDLYPENDAAQKVEILIASGTTLPDAFIGNAVLGSAPDITLYRHGQNGVFIPLNDYIEKHGYYLPQGVEKAANKSFMQFMTSPDGNIYALPAYQEQTSNTLDLRAYINKAWLDKLGLKMPTTTDELYTVLKAFKEKDPNGNGKADEIPMIGRNTYHCHPEDWIMNAFIYNDGSQRWMVKDGQLDVPYNKDEWREGLRYNNKLFSEGLLDPLGFTIDAAAFKALASAGDTNTIGLLGIMGMGQAFTVSQADRKAEYTAIGPLKGPNGVQWSNYNPVNPSAAMMITKDCKNPDVLFKLGDFMCSPEVALWSRFGEPGVDWVEPQPGDQALGAAWGAPAKLRAILVWGGATSRSHWSNLNPSINLENSDGQVWNGEPTDAEYMIAQSVPLYKPYTPKEVCNKIIYTAEEMESIADIKVAVESYVNESMARFITGDMSLEKDWDAYVKELETIGLNKYIEVSQAAYTRMMG